MTDSKFGTFSNWAADLLSHRHTTRDGDDLFIWSLLIGDVEYDSPVAMRERQTGKRIPSSPLASSAQRIPDHPGLCMSNECGALLQTMPRSGPRKIPVSHHRSLGRKVVIWGSIDKAVWEWKSIYE